MSTNSYRDASKRNFEALTKLYDSNYNLDCDDPRHVPFWRLGNAFDTMIDYLDVIDSSSAPGIEQMVRNQFNASAMCLGGLDNAWFDDFGWWTVAAQRALKRSFFTPQIFKRIYDDCWTRFTQNAPKVWKRHKPGTFDDYGPLVDEVDKCGVWNAYWKDTSCDYPGPKNGDPANKQLIGIQNTVTNALYLMAAQRDANSQGEAKNEFNFFWKWLTDKDLPFPLLWWLTGPNRGLVLERVSGFAGGKSASGTPPHGFQTDWAWTGDQGLMLANFCDAIPRQPTHRGVLLSMATGVLAGALQKLFRDGEVQNYTKEGWVPDGDGDDYDTGKSVFWRNFLYVWKTNGELRNFIAQPDYQKMLRDSANKVVNLSTDKVAFVPLTNQLAVLVAATAIFS